MTVRYTTDDISALSGSHRWGLYSAPRAVTYPLLPTSHP